MTHHQRKAHLHLYRIAVRRAELQSTKLGRTVYPDEISLSAGCQDGSRLLRWDRMEALQRQGLLWISRPPPDSELQWEPYVRLTPLGCERAREMEESDAKA
jgi:hypothetical protein